MKRIFFGNVLAQWFNILEDSKATRYANEYATQDEGPSDHFISFICTFVSDPVNWDVQNCVNKFIFFFRLMHCLVFASNVLTTAKKQI